MGKPDKQITTQTYEPKVLSQGQIDGYKSLGDSTIRPDYNKTYADTQGTLARLQGQDGQTQGFTSAINRLQDPTNGAALWDGLRERTLGLTGREHAERFGGTGSAGSSLSQVDLLTAQTQGLAGIDLSQHENNQERALRAATLGQGAHSAEQQRQMQLAGAIYGYGRDRQNLYTDAQKFQQEQARLLATGSTEAVYKPGTLSTIGGIAGIAGQAVGAATGLGFTGFGGGGAPNPSLMLTPQSGLIPQGGRSTNGGYNY